MDSVLALSALVISIFALVPSFTSNRYEKISFKDQVYDRFSQMWFDMDRIFIEHPEMHKYFYKVESTGEYAYLNPDDDDYALGICIAEMFSDVFQYTNPLEKYLSDGDRASYIDYKKMIMDAPIMKRMKQQHQWHKE